MQFPFDPSNENAFGVALLAGRVVGTVQGSTGHITVRATCKAKVNGKWVTVPFEKATHVFFDVPSADGEFADKIGTYYPAHSDYKWAGHWFEDRAQTDEKRIAAARYLMATITGEKDGKHVLKSERCARCSKELTHPDSIFAMFGPECIKHVAPFMPNRSGTDEGAHEAKANDHVPEDTLPGMSSEEFARSRALPIKTCDFCHGKPVRNAAQFSDPSAPPYAPCPRCGADAPTYQAEATRRETGTTMLDPLPSRESVEFEKCVEGVVATLKRGDDPKQVLAALDKGE
jgi:hypothetical protein